MEEKFIIDKIYPLLPELSSHGPAPSAVKALLIRDIGTGRVTVEYRIGDHIRVFAKLYTNALGAHCYAVLKGLWEEGIGLEEPYRIPEPLFYFPDFNLLIIRGVEGIELTSFIGLNESDLVISVRESARWLVKLHRSAVRVGEEGDFSSELLDLTKRMIKAAVAHPQEGEHLLDLSRKLKEAAKDLPQRRHTVQVHGRFRHDHVLVGKNGISAIDWDRSCPWDPAIDLAEFLHLLRLDTYKATRNPALVGPPTKAFLEEYLSKLPEHSANLAFYWGYYILHSLTQTIKNRSGNDPRVEAKIEFHQREFEEVISGRFL